MNWDRTLRDGSVPTSRAFFIKINNVNIESRSLILALITFMKLVEFGVRSPSLGKLAVLYDDCGVTAPPYRPQVCFTDPD